MGNHAGNKLDYKQEIMDEAMDRAKAECVFTERLYEILLAWQTGRGPIGQQPQGIPPGNVGELNYAMSRLYNQIWAAAVGLNDKGKSKKKDKQQRKVKEERQTTNGGDCMMGTIFYKASEDSEFFKKGDSISLTIAGDAGEVSDGYHTFNEIYTHRYLLFCGMANLAIRMPFDGTLYCWKSKTHWIDGELQPVWDGWFVAGIELNRKMITYHLPLEYWDLFDGIEREQAPPHDGHTSQDVIERLKEWLKAGREGN